MVIYGLRAADASWRLDADSRDGDGLWRRMDGKAIGADWSPPRLRVIQEPDEPSGLANDLVALSNGAPLLSRRAVDALAPLLSGTAELLPVETSIGDYHLLNVLNLIPALLEDQSEVFRYPSGGMGMVVRYELDPLVVADNSLFKLASWPTGSTLASQVFVDAVSANELSGFWFTKVWETSA